MMKVWSTFPFYWPGADVDVQCMACWANEAPPFEKWPSGFP